MGMIIILTQGPVVGIIHVSVYWHHAWLIANAIWVLAVIVAILRSCGVGLRAGHGR